MKVNNGNVNPILLNSAQNCPPQNADEPIDCAVRQNNFETTASDCIAQMGKAQVFMQNSSKTLKPQSDEEIIELINNIVKYDGMEIGRFCRGGEHISIGTPISGFKGLVNDDVRAKCIKNDDGTLKEIYFLNNKEGTVEVFDAKGKLKKQFLPREMKALKEYKYSPEAFHNFLRYGKESRLLPQNELDGFINSIQNIFYNDSKIWKTEKPITVYRALQDRLTPEQNEALSHIGGVFEDTSFVSTSTKKSTAERFANKNPILEIELPENSRYIDMDALFNIDRQHWQEQEFLLNKNSRFVVTGFDDENNIIKVKYLE